MSLLGDIMESSGFDILSLAHGTGVTLTIATGQGGAFSTSVAATAASQKDVRRGDQPGLDDETCTIHLKASAITSIAPPVPGWLLNVTSGGHQGKWTLDRVEPGGETAGVWVLRMKKAAMKGTPTA